MSGFRTFIAVEGLSDLNRSLRRVDSEAPKALRLALNDAADIVIRKVQQGIPRRTGKAVNSIKAASTRTSVRVRIGGSRAPYYPWLDWGGKTGKGKKTVRPFIREGRYLYPTLRTERTRFEAALTAALAGLARDAGLDVD